VLATLTRETTWLSSFLICEKDQKNGSFFARNKLAQNIVLPLVPVLFIGAWMLYIQHVLPPSATADASGTRDNWGLPFYSMFQAANWILSRPRHEITFENITTFPAFLSFTVQAFYLLRHWKTSDPVWRMGFPIAVLFLFLGWYVWSEHRNVCRIVLPMTFAFHLLLAKERPKRAWAWLILGNLHFPYGILNFLNYRV